MRNTMKKKKIKGITDRNAVNSRLLRRPIQRCFPLFLLPTLAAFCIGFIYPFLQGLYLSFCNFLTTRDATWVGLANYVKAFHDPSFLRAFWFTSLFALVSILVINLFAFTLAYALTQKIKGSNLFRTVFFMPNLIGGIVLGYIWSTIFDAILQNYGKQLATDATLGFWGLVILVAWQQIGYMMIIYIAGLQAVPEELNEAAKIDGAGNWRIFLTIYVPQAGGMLIILYILSFIGTWNDFMTPYLYLPSHPTLATGIQRLSAQISGGNAQYVNDYPKLFAAMLVTILPVMILFIAFQKRIMRFSLGGGIKG